MVDRSSRVTNEVGNLIVGVVFLVIAWDNDRVGAVALALAVWVGGGWDVLKTTLGRGSPPPRERKVAIVRTTLWVVLLTAALIRLLTT